MEVARRAYAIEYNSAVRKEGVLSQCVAIIYVAAVISLEVTGQ